MDKENTKAKLIQSLLELLGWNVYSAEVELKYPTRSTVETPERTTHFSLMMSLLSSREVQQHRTESSSDDRAPARPVSVGGGF